MCYIRRLGRSDFKLISRDELKWEVSTALARQRWIVHAFSTRAGGASRSPCHGLNLTFVRSDSRATVERNRQAFFQVLGVQTFHPATLKQVHSAQVFRAVQSESCGVEFIPAGSDAPLTMDGTPPVGDALVTDHPGILLSIRTADCLPVLIVDSRHHAVGALHAGWRGALGRVAEKVVGVMRGTFGSKPGELVAAIGPGIHACCYGVGEEVESAFRGRFVNSEDFFRPAPADVESSAPAAKYPNLFLSPFSPGHTPQPRPVAHLDLVAAIRDQLLSAGLNPMHIKASSFCTSCRSDLFFSHRREGPRTGRMMAVIGITTGKRG